MLTVRRTCTFANASSSGSAPALPEGFASEHGPRFYGLPLNEGTVRLERAEVQVPREIAGVVPFHAGETLNWRFSPCVP